MKYRTRRKPTDFDAVLIAESGTYPVKLRNVAPEGVKLTGLGGVVLPEAEVKLEVHGRQLPGRISWVDRDTAGVKLKTPLPRDIETLIARTTGGRAGHRRFAP